MANSERGEVSFEALGQSWTLKIGTGAMCEMEDALGKGISEISQDLAGKSVKLSLLRTIFWAALQRHHPGTTLQACEDIIDSIGIAEAGPLIGKAFQAAFPKKVQGARPPKATAA